MNIGYNNLFSSLDRSEQLVLEQEMGQIENEEYHTTVDKLENLSFHQEYDPSSLRRLTVIFLKAVKTERLTLAQYASFSLVTTAIRELVQDVVFFTAYKFKNSDGDFSHSYFPINRSKLLTYPSSVPQSYCLLSLGSNCADPSVTEPVRDPTLAAPMLKTFFDLDDEEWQNFLKKMEPAPASEKRYTVIHVPEPGHWSVIVEKIREILKGFQDQRLLTKTNNMGLQTQKVFPIPSFSMLQAFVDVKGEIHKERRLTLTPTFGILPSDKYAEYKWMNRVPIGLFFPKHKRSSDERIDFDGYQLEGWLALAIHDVYHALRELQINKIFFSIRKRWYEIAKDHPNNKKVGQRRPLSEILADGELVHSFPWNERSPFKQKVQNQGLRELLDYLSDSLHPELKRAFIRDIATHEREWREAFKFSLKDLGSDEQKIYEELRQIKAKL